MSKLGFMIELYNIIGGVLHKWTQTAYCFSFTGILKSAFAEYLSLSTQVCQDMK